jgi:hypothetical protein
VVLRGSGKELKDVWKTELLSLRGFELRIFFHVTHFDESKIQYHCPCSKYFTIILLSENFLKAISLAYTQETKLFTDSAKIELRGVDNGIYIDFELYKEHGKWFLTSEKDFSN